MFAPKPFVYPIKRVKRVIDGDNIEVDLDLGFKITWEDESVRLYDVDAFEIFGRNRDPIMGPIAKKFVELWLCGRPNEESRRMAEDPSLFVSPTGFITGKPYEGLILDSRKFNARDSFGRVLGDVYRPHDDVTLNKALVLMGLHEEG